MLGYVDSSEPRWGLRQFTQYRGRNEHSIKELPKNIQQLQMIQRTYGRRITDNDGHR
jgi:hypothetical protein